MESCVAMAANQVGTTGQKGSVEAKGYKRIARELAQGFESQALCALYETHQQWNLTSD